MAPLPDDFVDSSGFACAWYSADVNTAAAALPELAVDEPVDLANSSSQPTNNRLGDCGHM